ncbi:hypothetical protein FDP41_008992 [Naegleria fowleri]|uniref:Uncharacterized protein n=1 Tax=Naegleria fowleri TaxID=5763 RepID=A0A6A5AZD1_NAEFO|nr:uncharacterized protein FDP41_008992 [Naegleria fowleri]KAF0972743.1 hypothetical protein FDP41_008992 [Naegleria fowleri]
MKKKQQDATTMDNSFPITSQSPSFSQKSSSRRGGSSSIQQQQHLHLHHVVVQEKKSKYNEEEEDEDDMEVMSVNDQQQFLNHTNKKKNIDQSSESNKIKGSNNFKKLSSDVKNSVNSSKGSVSSKDITVSDDTIPLKLKKKPYPDTLEEEQLSHQEVEQDCIDEGELDHDDESVTNSNNSLHILSTVRQKLHKGQNVESNKPEKPSKMAEYIKRFRTAPPTKRSERKRLDKHESVEVKIENPKIDQHWKTKLVTDSNEQIHPSIRNIRNLKESIKNEIDEVDNDIRMARRHKPSEDYDLSPQLFSLKEKFSYIDALDVDITELNNMTEEALENGSFHLLNNLESKKSNPSPQNSSVISKNTTDSEDDYDGLFEENIRSRLKSLGLSDSVLGINHLKGELTLEEKADDLIKQKGKSINVQDSKDILDKEDRNFICKSPTKLSTSKISISETSVNPTRISEPTNNPRSEESTSEKAREQTLKKENTMDINISNKTSANMESFLGQSLQSVSSVSSVNDNDISVGCCQRMIEEMVTSQDFSEETPTRLAVDINDDDHELFTSDYICQTLRQKIDFLKKRLSELEAQR